MKTNKFGEMIYSESDLADQVMQGRKVWTMPFCVEEDIDIERLVPLLENPEYLMSWTFSENSDISVPVFDQIRQSCWYMPDEYRDMDIAEHILGLCETQEQLQRCGEELLMFQEHGLFDLLKYMKYLVDVMRENRVIWGVGRGSSVASYVLYKLGVHRIDSMHYDLNPREFLR
jgi:hypothetical protein